MNSVIDRPPPPTKRDDRGGGGAGWTKLFRAANEIEGNLLSGRLAEAGVETQAIKDRSSSAAWLHNGSSPWTPVDVWVRTCQWDEANLVLAEIAFDQPARAPGSVGGGDWRVPVLWWATALSLALALTGIALARTADYLERCGFSTECETPSGR